MLEKTSYPVVVRFYNKFIGNACYRVKYQKATSLENAQKIVASYCAYHRKKRKFVSESSIMVIQKPVFFQLTFTCNRHEHEHDAVAICNMLIALKSVVVTEITSFISDDDNDIREFLLHFDGEDALEPVIKQILFKEQKFENIIDYSFNCAGISSEFWAHEYGVMNGSLDRYLDKYY